MRIIVSDNSCLIDLRKVSLLGAFVRLPYEISAELRPELCRYRMGGLKVMDVPGESVFRAQQVISDRPGLSIHDGFAFVLAEICQGASSYREMVG